MKFLTLILASLALGLTACGSSFEAGEFTMGSGAGASGALTTSTAGSGSSAGAIGLGRAGSDSLGEAGAGGAAGAPDVAPGGSAGAAPAGGSGGGAGHAGAAAGGNAGGSGGTAGSGGASGAPGAGGSAGSTPLPPPCANPKDVTGGTSGALGGGEVCLRTMETFSTVGCSSFEGRTLKVNGEPATCGAPGAYTPIGGYNYFEVSAGGFSYASINWF